MGFLTFLSAWYSWPFLVALLIAVLLFTVEILFGGLSDFGIDLDADLDFDIDLDVDTDFEFDTPHILSWLGMGKIPISVLLEMCFFFFGAIGLMIMSIAYSILGPTLAAGALLVAFPVAIFGTMYITHSLAGTIARLIPQHSTTTKKAVEFRGSVGVTMSKVETDFGQVSVGGALLNARTSEGTIARGTEVVLVEYNSGGHYYIVEATKAN